MLSDHALALAPYLDPLDPAPPELYVPRPGSPLESLELARAGARRRHCLLIGAMGSGKSTELAHLARSLAGEADPPVVALLRLQDQCAPHALTAPQVLFLLGVAALALGPGSAPDKIRRALEAAYRDIVEEPARAEVDVAELVARIALVVGGAGVAAGQMWVTALAGAATAVAKSFRNLPRLSLPGRGRHLAANDAPVNRLAEAVAGCMEWTSEEYDGIRVAFFLDGLDRLDPESVGEVFGSGVLALPPCPVVYTAPIALRYSVEGGPLEASFDFLSVGTCPVFDRSPDGAHKEAGFAALRRVLERRIKAAGLRPEQVVRGGLVPGGPADRLIEVSGGITQTFIQLCDSALRRGRVHPGPGPEVLGTEQMGQAIEALEQRTADRLEPGHVDTVLECWRTQERPEGEAGNRLLFYNLVLCYPDGWSWFRPTPLLVRYLRDRYPDRCPAEDDSLEDAAERDG